MDQSTNTHGKKAHLALQNNTSKSKKKKKAKGKSKGKQQNKTACTPPALAPSTMTEPQRNEPGISERRGIRWVCIQLSIVSNCPNIIDQLPDSMEEPTSTLVLTSSRRQFVDIRIICGPGQALPNEGEFNLAHFRTALTTPSGGPSKLLDWAIAGESTNSMIGSPSIDHPSNPEPPTDGTRMNICHTSFSHWIDSHSDTPASDAGDMYPQPDGSTLELGIMPNPLTNHAQPYEEVWVDFSASAVDGKRWSIVIDLDDTEHKAKGRVVRVGEHCQAILKVGDQVTVERWKFEVAEKQEKGAWKRLARLGDLFLPCSLAFTPERIIEGNTVTYGDYHWQIKEVFSW
jgi:hypothetical protein